MRKIMAWFMVVAVLCVLSGCGKKAENTQTGETEATQVTSTESTQVATAEKKLTNMDYYLLGKWKCTSVNPKGNDDWTGDASVVGDRTLEFFEDHTAKAVINGEEYEIKEWKFIYYSVDSMIFDLEELGLIKFFFNTGHLTVGLTESNTVADWYSYEPVVEESKTE